MIVAMQFRKDLSVTRTHSPLDLKRPGKQLLK